MLENELGITSLPKLAEIEERIRKNRRAFSKTAWRLMDKHGF